MLVPPASDAIRMLRLTELLAPDRLVEGFAVNDAHAPPSKLIQNWLPMLGTVERYQFGAPNLVWLPMIDPSELNHTVAVEVPLPAASLDAPQLMGVTMPPPRRAKHHHVDTRHHETPAPEAMHSPPEFHHRVARPRGAIVRLPKTVVSARRSVKPFP